MEDSIYKDIMDLVKRLQEDKKYNAPLMYMPDAWFIEQGLDPNEYPELDGYPGVRIMEMK